MSNVWHCLHKLEATSFEMLVRDPLVVGVTLMARELACGRQSYQALSHVLRGHGVQPQPSVPACSNIASRVRAVRLHLGGTAGRPARHRTRVPGEDDPDSSAGVLDRTAEGGPLTTGRYAAFFASREGLLTNHSYVLFNPSSSWTIGSNPNTRRALSMLE